MEGGNFRNFNHTPPQQVSQDLHPGQMYLPDMHPARFCKAAIIHAVQTKKIELDQLGISDGEILQAQGVVRSPQDVV